MKKLFSSLILVMLVAIPVLLFAQFDGPVPHTPEPEAPLGAIAILAAGGGAYAIKKLRDRNRE